MKIVCFVNVMNVTWRISILQNEILEGQLVVRKSVMKRKEIGRASCRERVC